MRLVIGGPTLASVPASFAEDLARLYAFTKEHGPWTWVHIDFQPSTYVHVGREAVLHRAIEIWHATHVLWLDADMGFPADAAIRLATHEKSIVASNCVMRDPRLLFTAFKNGARVDSTASSGLDAVDQVGMAVMLMRTDIVAGLNRPWFEHGRTDAGGDIGEDVMFCRKLRAAGQDIYIDHDLSKEIGHVGQHTYRIPARTPVAV